jgi:hypothetical protein
MAVYMDDSEKIELLYSTLQKKWQKKYVKRLTTRVSVTKSLQEEVRSLEEIVSQTFRLKYREIVSILERQNIPYTEVKVRRLQGQYRYKYKNEYHILNSKNEPYSLNEDDYGVPQFDSVDEVEDFAENCKLSFSERLKITQLFINK